MENYFSSYLYDLLKLLTISSFTLYILFSIKFIDRI